MTESTRPPPTVTYWAISTLSSRTWWFGVFTVLLGLLSQPAVAALVPLKYLPGILSAVGFMVMYLRTVTTRPVRMMPPGETQAVEVPKIGPPDPPAVTD